MGCTSKAAASLLATSVLAAQCCAAQTVSGARGAAEVDHYLMQQDVDSLRAWQSTSQMTRLNQLSDIKPTDWAYQALGNLVRGYGCVAGYPDGRFQGLQAISRYEAAAILNACLERVSEQTDELRQLLKEFSKELQLLTANLTGLEDKVGRLQAQQFSITTKLKGEASFILGGIPGYSYAGQNSGATTFNHDIRLNFDTSYTGQDLLRTRIHSANFSLYPFGTAATPFKLDKAEDWANTVFVDRLYYTFPLRRDNSLKVTIGALVRNTETAWLATAYHADVLDFFTTTGTGGVYNKANGEGIGIQWQQPTRQKSKGVWLFNANYVVGGAASSQATPVTGVSKIGRSGADSSYGIFNSNSGLNALAQIGYRAEQWGAAIGYRFGSTGSTIRDGAGAASAGLYNTNGGVAVNNSLAFNTYWLPEKTGLLPSISAGYGVNIVSGQTTPATANSSRSWMVGFQWDQVFSSHHAAGLAFGQPSYANQSVAGSQSKPWLFELFYKLNVSDQISITPALIYGSSIANNAASSPATNTTFTGLGGVIQTSFNF
jgi:hypothetical protein